MKSITPNTPFKRYGFFAFVAITLSLTSLDLGDFQFFYRASQALLSGTSPYTIPGFMSPLHLMAYSLPLALLPYSIAYHINQFICAFALLYVFNRLVRGNVVNLVILCMAPWLLFLTWYGQIEWALLLALFVHPVAGIFLLMLKPQIGWLPAIFLLSRMSRKQAVLCLLGLAIVFLVSFALGINWTGVVGANWSTAVFPLTAFLAIPIVVAAWRWKRLDMLLSIAPALPPYVGPQSWSVLAAWLSRYRWSLAVFVVLSWLLVIAWRTRI